MHRDCSSEAGRDRAPQVWCHRWFPSIITLRRALSFISLVSADAPWAPAEKAAGSDGDATVAPTLVLRHGDACGHLSWRTGANYCQNLHLITNESVLWTMATFFRPQGNYFLKCKSHPCLRQTCIRPRVVSQLVEVHSFKHPRSFFTWKEHKVLRRVARITRVNLIWSDSVTLSVLLMAPGNNVAHSGDVC